MTEVQRRRVLFSGSVASNGGDRAILEAQLDVLRHHNPACAITVADSSPPVAARVLRDVSITSAAFPTLVGAQPSGRAGRLTTFLRVAQAHAAVRLRRWRLPPVLPLSLSGRRFVRDFCSHNGVLYMGGTSLIEDYRLRSKFFELELARAAGMPVILMPQSLGPFADRDNQRRMRGVMRHAAVVMLRDGRSLKHLEQIRARTDKVRVLPDIVFAMTSEQALRRLATSQLPADGCHFKVGVNIRTVENMARSHGPGSDERFIGAMAAAVGHLVRTKNADVVFVSTCQGVPEYRTDDSRVADSVVAQLPDELRRRVRVDHAFHSTDDLIGLLAGFDMVLSTRLHGAILALAAGTPVLPIAYEFKTHEVFAQLGASRWVLDVATVDGNTMAAALDAFVGGIDAERDNLAHRLREMASDAREAGALADAALTATDGTAVSQPRWRPRGRWTGPA